MSDLLGENQGKSIDRRLFLGGVGGVTAAAAATAFAPGALAAPAEDEPLALPASMRPSSASALALRSFSKIDGTPVYYWRSNRPNTTLRTWYCTQGFYDRLVVWIRDLRRLSGDAGYGNVRYLVSAGFYVNKPGQHGAGTAMDLDHVRWSSGKRVSPLDGHHVADSLYMRRRYLAVEATLRKRFCYVLDGWYPNHYDHFHADFADLPTLLSKGSRSATYFIQACANRFMGAGIAIDGDWGPITDREYNRLRNRLNISGDPTSSISAYRNMLTRIANRGFRNQSI